MTHKKYQNNKSYVELKEVISNKIEDKGFLEEFEESASKKSIEETKRLDEQIEQEKESIYAIPLELQDKGYYSDETGIYCLLENGYYLKMWRISTKGNTNKTYCYAYYDYDNDVLNPSTIKLDKGIYDYGNDGDKKGLHKTLNQQLGYQTEFINWKRCRREDGKGFVTDNLSSIYKDFMDLLQKGIIINVLTDNYKPKEEVEPEKNEEKTATKKTKSFEEYPTQIQKDALQIIEKGKLFNNIKETAQLTHANDNKLIETLILIHASIYSGTPVQTIVGGETGKGKTDITQTIAENYPKDHIFYLRTFSPKYIYYDKDNFNEDYNILLIDDVDLSKTANIEVIKELTDNKKIVKELRTVIDGKAVTFTLKGKFIVILTYAKTNPDLELGNRLFNTGIITDKNKESKVKHQIKSNTIIGTDNNSIIKQLQETNQCAITKLIEDNYEIFNPYLLFMNPEQFNNRDVSSFINLVNAHTFYNIQLRNTIKIGDKNIKIGTKEDIEKILNLWDSKTQKYKLNTRQQQILKLDLAEYTLEEAMEQQQKTIKEYNETDSTGYKEKIKRKQWSRERIAKETESNINTIRFDLDTNKSDTNNETLYSLGLIERYRFDPEVNNSMWVYYKPKIENNEKSLKSDKSYMYGCTNEMYRQNISLKDKISIIINLLYMYNYVVNERDIIYIKNHCEEFPNIVDDDSMFCFINEFFNSYKDLVLKNENTSIIDIKNMFDLINPYLINYEDDDNKNKYIYTKTPETDDFVQAEKIEEKPLNSNQIQNSLVHLKSTSSTNTQNLNKEFSVKFGDVVVELTKTDVKILVDICDILRDNCMSCEEINKNYPHDPDNPDEHVILKLRKTLSKFKDYGFLNFKSVNNVYKYSINNECLSKTYILFDGDYIPLSNYLSLVNAGVV